MFSPLRNRFGIPGVISVIALVFAMLGGAYAASDSSGGGKATASAKAKKGPRGPKGATGPAGPAGPTGPAGAKGDAGANGSNGSNGTPGTAGAAGKSVTGEAFEGTDEPAGEPCEEAGGVEFKSASPAPDYACNGVDGQNGSPWTLGGTLPAGATETGSWFFRNVSNEQEEALPVPATSISFTVPLAAPLPEEAVHYVKASETAPTACENATHPGVASLANPEAASGNLCVYEAELSGDLILNNFLFIAHIPDPGSLLPGADTFGARLVPYLDEGEVGDPSRARGSGSWAVTG